MQRFVKQSLAATATALLLSALALLFAQGRIFPQVFAASPFAKPLGDSCFRLSLPGVMVAVAIWGYSSGRTMLSDMLIVAVNGALYAVPLILFSGPKALAKARHKSEGKRVTVENRPFHVLT